MRLVAIGLLAGLFSALFGVGGGIVAVPLLILAVRLEPRSATATSLGMIGITALAGTIGYAFGGHVEVGYAALVGIPAAFGAVARSVDPAAAQRAHALLPLLGAPRRDRREAARHVTFLVVAVALGVAAGVLSGLFGVGGGILFVPILLALGLTQLDAEATSLLAILPTVAAGIWRQQRYGNVRWRSSLVLGLASIAGRRRRDPDRRRP